MRGSCGAKRRAEDEKEVYNSLDDLRGPSFRRKAGTEARSHQPERYGSMRTIEAGDEYWIMVDTETGCCYLFGARGGVVQLTNYDGSPHLANGWRDIG